MKFDFTLPLVVGGLAYVAWYFWYFCVQKGDRVYIAQGGAIPTIYPPPPGVQAPPQDLPLYLPRPPLLPGPGNDTCGFPCGLFNPPNCQPQPQCLAYPLCEAGSVVNPMTCSCVPECWVVQNAGIAALCPAGSHWNWCVKGCVPDGSMMPDCPPPTCSA